MQWRDGCVLFRYAADEGPKARSLIGIDLVGAQRVGRRFVSGGNAETS